jgi:hypothetical protein
MFVNSCKNEQWYLYLYLYYDIFCIHPTEDGMWKNSDSNSILIICGAQFVILWPHKTTYVAEQLLQFISPDVWGMFTCTALAIQIRMALGSWRLRGTYEGQISWALREIINNLTNILFKQVDSTARSWGMHFTSVLVLFYFNVDIDIRQN